jgi:hypothetical protein
MAHIPPIRKDIGSFMAVIYELYAICPKIGEEYCIKNYTKNIKKKELDIIEIWYIMDLRDKNNKFVRLKDE